MSRESEGSSDTSGNRENESLGEQRTDLAYDRSGEAAERTLMAAVRTAVSMISFGFTIAKLFDSLDKLNIAKNRQMELDHLPFPLGLVLLIGGTLTIAFGLFEYVGVARKIARSDGKKIRFNTALFTAIFVLFVGLFLSLIGVIHTFPSR